MNPKKLFAAALVAGSLVASVGAQAATVLTLNPSSSNGAAGGVIDATHGAFQTDNIHGQLTSKLTINALSGGASFEETGTILINEFLLNNISQNSGVYRAGGGKYDLYATFISTGSGVWGALGPNTFSVVALSTLNVKLWASPSNGTSQIIATPTNSAVLGSGVTAGNKDFLLANASFLSDGTEGGSATRAGTKGQTFLSANLDFFPAPGTEGSGFFQAPTPFKINLGSSTSTNGNQTKYAVVAGKAIFTTPVGTTGTSNLTPTAVPEPGALSLVGLALLGLGLAGKRKSTAKAVVAA